MTECSAEQLEFHALGKRAVVGRFDGGAISSDGGGLLLSEVEVKTRNDHDRLRLDPLLATVVGKPDPSG